MLLATILSYDGANVIIEFGLNGKVENQPLIWEQTVIAFTGIEFLILPWMETDHIAVEGYTASPVFSRHRR